MRTTSISERAAATKPWPRMSATLLPPRVLARSRPCGMLVTRRWVSDADMAVGIDDVLVRQDAVGDDEVVEGRLDFPGLHHLPGAVRAEPAAASRSSASNAAASSGALK